MVFLCICLHSASPEWLRNKRLHFSGRRHLLWFSYVFANILHPQSDSAVSGCIFPDALIYYGFPKYLQSVPALFRTHSFAIVFVSICTHSAFPECLCSRCLHFSGRTHLLRFSYVFAYILHPQSAFAVGVCTFPLQSLASEGNLRRPTGTGKGQLGI